MITKGYKLTDKNWQTKFCTRWGPGVTNTVQGHYSGLCSPGWLHFYRDPIQAALFRDRHVFFKNPVLWLCRAEGRQLHQQDKSGAKRLTTIRRVKFPKVTRDMCCAIIVAEMKIAFKYVRKHYLLYDRDAREVIMNSKESPVEIIRRAKQILRKEIRRRKKARRK